MGIVHVLTGPDHLSALATLSANVGNFRAFWYGIQWGIGHSIGLVVVGSTFILLSSKRGNSNANGNGNDDDGDKNGDDDGIFIPDSVETIGECFVGIFMLALGCYSLVKAYRIRRGILDNANGNGNDNAGGSGDDDDEMRYTAMDDEDVHDYGFDVDREDRNGTQTSGNHGLSQENAIENHANTDAPHSHSHHDHLNVSSMQEGIPKKLITVVIGIVHGVAGPGGVLGVIPAVQLHNPWLSTVYLGSFCVASTFTMGCFAALYGVCSSKLTQDSKKLAWRMEVFSASLSILVGGLWLTLLYLGILEDVFP